MPERSRLYRIVLFLLHLAFSTIGLVCVPAIVLGRSVLKVESRDLLALALVAVAYAAWLLWFTRRRTREGSKEVWRVIVAGCVVIVPVLLAIIVLHPEFSRPALFVSLLLGLALMLAVSRLGALPELLVVAALAVLGISLQVLLGKGVLGGSLKPTYSATQLASGLYDLSLVSYSRRFPTTKAQQGGISRFGDRFVLANGDGDLFLFRRVPRQRELDVTKLPYKVPLNRDAFVAAGGPTTGDRTWFRVADVLTQKTEAGYRLFVTHHFWKEDPRCWVMRVSSLEGREQDFLTASDAMRWSTVYETQPCVPLVQEGEPVRFSGLNNGGRMALMDDGRLLVSIGDHEMDGYASTIQAAQDPVGSYGKMILVDLRQSQQTAEIFSIGHRNPQGLLIASGGEIWETEHGPQGGDELNLVHRGANYGWPLASYGTEYGTHAWPLSETPGSHEQFEQPFYSWVPSIGISNLIEVQGTRFEHWAGDLLVSSLRDRALWRLRTREGRVVMAERIEFGQRIRDLEIGPDGELVLMADGGSIHFIEPREGAETGEGLYRVCAGCHVPPKGSATAVGPSLEGVVGRKVAALPDFEYSDGMRRAGGTWTPERLDAFLADPASTVAGTTMLFNGIRDASARKKLVEYMASPESKLGTMPALVE